MQGIVYHIMFLWQIIFNIANYFYNCAMIYDKYLLNVAVMTLYDFSSLGHCSFVFFDNFE